MTEAFLSRTMDRYGDSVYRIALCRLQRQPDAEDAYQDTFLALFQQSDADKWEEEHLKAWLIRVAIHKSTDIARRRKQQSYVELEEISGVAARDVYGSVEIWDAVSRLPEKLRIIFHLHYGEGYQTQAIADLLNIPASTVRVYLNRARTTLRKELTCYESIS